MLLFYSEAQRFLISANILVNALLLWGSDSLIFISFGIAEAESAKNHRGSQALGTGAK